MEKRRGSLWLMAAVAFVAIACAACLAWMSGNGGFRNSLILLEDTVKSILLESEGDGVRRIDWDKYPESIVAWVEVPGTSVDEPVAQAEESEPNAYLTIDALGRGSYGTPYLDWECNPHSAFAVIYGHHVSDGTVFADLARYSNEGYARKHPIIYLYTRDDDCRHAYRVVAADVVDAWRETIQVSFDEDGERRKYLAGAIEGSDTVIGGLPENADVLALVTCSYQTGNSRTVVYAVEAGDEGA